MKGWLQNKRTISTRLHAKRYKFENNRRLRSKLPSANLQVTCAPASRSLAPQNPSQLHDNRSLINKHLTFTLRHEPQAGKITTSSEYSRIATSSARLLIQHLLWEYFYSLLKLNLKSCNAKRRRQKSNSARAAHVFCTFQLPLFCTTTTRNFQKLFVGTSFPSLLHAPRRSILWICSGYTLTSHV